MIVGCERGMLNGGIRGIVRRGEVGVLTPSESVGIVGKKGGD